MKIKPITRWQFVFLFQKSIEIISPHPLPVPYHLTWQWSKCLNRSEKKLLVLRRFTGIFVLFFVYENEKKTFDGRRRVARIWLSSFVWLVIMDVCEDRCMLWNSRCFDGEKNKLKRNTRQNHHYTVPMSYILFNV